MVGIVSLHLRFGTPSRFSRRSVPSRGAPQIVAARRNCARKTKKPPSVQDHGSTFFVTEDHARATGAAAVMPSHLTVRCQRQRLSFIHRGPECPENHKKQQAFNGLFAERPFRLAKLTACRKKFAFLSAQQGEVKGSRGKIAASPDTSPV
jgi:hypothetical protein